jgi:hypothetical protein
VPSIYRPKHSVIVPEADVAHRAQGNTSPDDLRRATSVDQPDWVSRRKAQPADVLLPSTQRWLHSLPDESRPQALARQFPRLANLIAANWGNTRDCSAFIYSLLRDERGGRRGFPPEVMEDIINLRMYYARLHPIVDWDAGVDAESYRRR